MNRRRGDRGGSCTVLLTNLVKPHNESCETGREEEEAAAAAAGVWGGAASSYVGGRVSLMTSS